MDIFSFPIMMTIAAAGLTCIFMVTGIKYAARRRERSDNLEKTNRIKLVEAQDRETQAQNVTRELLERLQEPYKDFLASGFADIQSLGDRLLETMRTLVPCASIVLLVLDPETQLLEPVASRGLSSDQLRALKIRPDEGVFGRTLQSGKPLSAQAARSSGILAESFLGTNYALIPLQIQGHMIAVLALASIGPELAAQEYPVIELMQGYGSLLLDAFYSRQSVEATQEHLIQALMRCVLTKDGYTHGHLERTALLTRAFAREMKLPRALVRQIEIGALLHDLGKIWIPETILQKPGALTPEEYADIKRHPGLGYEIIRPYAFLRGAAFIVLYHQEWFNGAGYPQNLAREEIPLGARLVSIVDAWDAMTSDRPYRLAMPRQAAFAELRRQAGTQFDPKLVEPFVHTVERLEAEGIPTTEVNAANTYAAR